MGMDLKIKRFFFPLDAKSHANFDMSLCKNDRRTSLKWKRGSNL